jgi:hypothetical protein
MSAVESYETHKKFLDIVPVETLTGYLHEVPLLETKNGPREYGILCAAMKSEEGEECVVRKDHNADSDDSTDWLVMRSDGVNLWQDVILGVKTIKGVDGDTIELLLAPDVDYHGPYTLRFNVDLMYGPVDSEITLTHQKYYGRGVGEVPEEQIDAVYNQSLLEEQKLAEVIPIEMARIRRQQKEVGHTAVAN